MPIEHQRRFYARIGDDELSGLKATSGVAEVLMELDTSGRVRRFIGVSAEGRPLFRCPARRPPPFDFSGLFPESAVLEEDRISEEEFETTWGKAAECD